jgi:hypothetical protein
MSLIRPPSSANQRSCGPSGSPVSNRIALSWCEKALAPPSRAEHQHGVRAGRSAEALCPHRILREFGGTARQRAEFPGDDAGDVARAYLLIEELPRHGRHFGPGASQGGHIARLIDVVAEFDRRAGPQPQQVASRDRADDPAVFRDRCKVPDAPRAHAPDRAIDKGILRHGNDRSRRDLAHRRVESRRACFADGAQEVPFRHDSRAGCELAGLADKGGGNAPLHEQSDDVAKHRVGPGEDGRLTHEVAHPVAIREAVEPLLGLLAFRFSRCGYRLGPAGAMVLLENCGQAAAGLLRLRERADADVPQAGHQLEEDLRGERRVGERPVALAHLRAEPGRERLEGVVPESRLDELREEPGVETRPARSRAPGAGAFPLQHGEVEPDRVPDDDARADEALEIGPDLAKRRLCDDIRIRDAMDRRGGRGDRHARRDEALERRPALDGAVVDAQSRDFDEPRVARVEAGGLCIESHRIDGEERCDAGRRGHRSPDRVALCDADPRVSSTRLR